MNRLPIVMVSPDVAAKGSEFGDLSTSFGATYQAALMEAGAIPLAMPLTASREVIAACVGHSDGVLLTGGDDVEPRIYDGRMPGRLRRLAKLTPDGGGRDYRELVLVDEVFRQRKPLLAICRGHQVLNVGLGGTLYADIGTQRRGALPHRRMDRRSEIVHQVELTAGSLLARIAAKAKLGVNSTHHQAVARVAPPLQATAVSQDGIVEGMELRPGAAGALPFLLSVQFHPERLADRYAEHRGIFQAFAQACRLSRDKKL
jgi:putative glutamine amidotransferase